jgi:hypothetical protein
MRGKAATGAGVGSAVGATRVAAGASAIATEFTVLITGGDVGIAVVSGVNSSSGAFKGGAPPCPLALAQRLVIAQRKVKSGSSTAMPAAFKSTTVCCARLKLVAEQKPVITMNAKQKASVARQPVTRTLAPLRLSIRLQIRRGL